MLQPSWFRRAVFLCAFAVAARSVPAAAIYTSLVPGGNTLPANDDGSSPLTPLGFSANFFGVSHTSLYANNNGNVTFGSAQSAYVPFALSGATARPIIAPFFSDVDTRDPGSGLLTYGTGSFTTNDGVLRNVFVANWVNVGYYNKASDKLNAFQLLLVDQGAGDFDIVFNYDQVAWDQSGKAAAGYSAGTGAAGTFHQFAGSNAAGAFLDNGPASTALILNTNVSPTDAFYSRVDGRYVFRVRNGDVTSSEMPEPATFSLVPAAGALLYWLQRRRRIAACAS